MQHQQPPALCFFWDIQNCAVPSGTSPYDCVRAIRAAVEACQPLYLAQGKTTEVGFNVYCDIGGLSKDTRAQLGRARATTRDVSSKKQGAADIRLLQDILHHTITHRSGTIVLISGDIDFAETVHDLVHTGGYRVVLIHNRQARKELCQNASEALRFEDVVAGAVRKWGSGKSLAPPPAEAKEWSCNSCTLLNPITAATCSVCSTPRAGSVGGGGGHEKREATKKKKDQKENGHSHHHHERKQEPQPVCFDATPFCSDTIPNCREHNVAHINNKKLGNENSWIPGPNKIGGVDFIGLRFKEPCTLQTISVGRDGTGKFNDRLGACRIEFTATTDPQVSHLTTNWQPIANVQTTPQPQQIKCQGQLATGVRVVVCEGMCLDHITVMGTPVKPQGPCDVSMTATPGAPAHTVAHINNGRHGKEAPWSSVQNSSGDKDKDKAGGTNKKGGNARQWKCQFPGCDKVFGKKESLDQHAEAAGHDAECHTCGRVFLSTKALGQHQESTGHQQGALVKAAKNLAIDLSTVECHECRKKFQSTKSLEQHQKKTRHTQFSTGAVAATALMAGMVGIGAFFSDIRTE